MIRSRLSPCQSPIASASTATRNAKAASGSSSPTRWITHTLGFILALVVTVANVGVANVGERATAKLVLAKLTGRWDRLHKILADQGFDGSDFVAQVKAAFGVVLQMVCQVLGVKGFVVLPKRWIVERSFGWLAFHRRLTKEYEVKIAHSQACIYWAMIRIMARRFRET